MFSHSCPGCRRLHSVLLGSVTRTLGVIGCIRCHWCTRPPRGGRWVHQGSLLTGVHTRERWVDPGSLGSLSHTLSVVGFFCPRREHSCMPRGSLGTSCVVGFPLARPGGCWVHSGSLANYSEGFFRGVWDHSLAPCGS